MLTLFPDWFQETSPDNRFRYVLRRVGERPLITIGLNPSTAAPGNPDPTIKAVERHVLRLGYDSWVMLNLFPLRETNPNLLPAEAPGGCMEAALPAITAVLQSCKDAPVWAAWGAHIHLRTYLLTGLKLLVDLPEIRSRSWFHIGALTKQGHPRHPLYLAGNQPAAPFNIADYMASQSSV